MTYKVKKDQFWLAVSNRTQLLWPLLMRNPLCKTKKIRFRFAVLLEKSSKFYPWLRVKEKSHKWTSRTDIWPL